MGSWLDLQSSGPRVTLRWGWTLRRLAGASARWPLVLCHAPAHGGVRLGPRESKGYKVVPPSCFSDFATIHSSLPRWSPLSRWTPSDVGWFITPMKKYRYIYHKPKWNWSYVHLVSVHELWHHLVPDRGRSMAGQAHHRSDGDSHPKITQRTSTAPLSRHPLAWVTRNSTP